MFSQSSILLIFFLLCVVPVLRVRRVLVVVPLVWLLFRATVGGIPFLVVLMFQGTKARMVVFQLCWFFWCWLQCYVSLLVLLVLLVLSAHRCHLRDGPNSYCHSRRVRNKCHRIPCLLLRTNWLFKQRHKDKRVKHKTHHTKHITQNTSHLTHHNNDALPALSYPWGMAVNSQMKSSCTWPSCPSLFAQT